MLSEISIRNYALIESLRVEFGAGLNALTGETGAGKSIIVDALGLLLGEKASASFVKKGADRCEASGLFSVKRSRTAKKFLSDLSLQNPDDDDLLFIRREVDAQGKSRAFVNDRPVNLSTLADLGELLVDVHGQHDHQLLLKPAGQRDLLDRFAGCDDLRDAVAEDYRLWKDLASEKESSQLSEREKNQRIDLYRFQVNEIESAKLSVGEEEEIERALPQLKHAGKLRALADELYSHLYESDGSVSERLLQSKKALEGMLGFGADLGDAATILEEARVRVEELATRADKFRDNLSADPNQVDALISRQDAIAKLKRKYGATVQDILEYKEKTAHDLAKLEGHAQALEELDKKISASRDRLLKDAKKLSAARRKATDALSAAAQKELKDLGFLKARFEVALIADEEPSPSGLERAEFLFCANPGEDLKPLRQAASGGELSRVMLALKKVLAQADVVPTVVFDEIDSGIGGSMGNVVGEKLKALSKTHQILLITHLPQIAARAGRHLSVRKSAAGQKTQVHVGFVDEEERVREIARMLGGVAGAGGEPTPASLKHASELLAQAR